MKVNDLTHYEAEFDNGTRTWLCLAKAHPHPTSKYTCNGLVFRNGPRESGPPTCLECMAAKNR